MLLLVWVFYKDYFDETTNASSISGLSGIGAYPVSFCVWGIGLSLSGTMGYAINPTRDLGPRIAHALMPMKHKGDSDWAYSWITVSELIIGDCLLFSSFQSSRRGI